MQSEAIKILNRILHYSRRKGTCVVCYLSLDKNGYSEIWINGKNYRTHRVIMHLLAEFDLDSKKLILHDNICISKACIEFTHLRIGTVVDNNRDTIVKQGHNNSPKGPRKTHCPAGHLYNPKEVNKKGAQICKPCQTAEGRRQRDKQLTSTKHSKLKTNN